MFKSFLSRRIIALILALGIMGLAGPISKADEGLWTFDNPPLKQLKEKYGFEPSKEWLDHVRLSSVRLNDGGSGSFVSPNGLLMTNHHVVDAQLGKLSTETRDLLKGGFYARSREEELKCPDLEINVLMSLENVTDKVDAAIASATSDKDAAAKRQSVLANLAKESSDKTGLRSDIVTLYNGGEYWIYRYKKYTDIRLVFAPELQLAQFGGDPDNFTYPRYDLDVSFVRVYENGQPIKTDNFLRWSKAGAEENDLVFVSGHPGSTSRQDSVAQLEYFRDHLNPQRLRILKRRKAVLTEYASKGADQNRRAQSTLLGVLNSLKAITGYQEGLLQPKVMAKKVAEEKDLRAKVAGRSDLQKYAGAWDQLATVYKDLPTLNKRLTFSGLRYSRMAGLATALVRYGTEVKKPNDQRLPEYQDTALESLKFRLLSPAPVYLDFEELVLGDALQESLDELGPNDPFVKQVIGNRNPKELAKELITNSKINNPEFRKSLLEGGASAIESSNDPLISVVRKIDPMLRELRHKVEDEVGAVESSAGEKIGKARFAVYGKSLYPDATFSLRLSYGTVKGYEAGTTFAPYKNTFAGLYDRSASFDNKPPFDLSQHTLDRQPMVNLRTPFNFTFTADIIGGNSGSPIFNRNAEIVGIVFDGNIQSLVWEYSYTEDQARSIGVHSAGILEALRKIYDAYDLADELTKN